MAKQIWPHSAEILGVEADWSQRGQQKMTDKKLEFELKPRTQRQKVKTKPKTEKLPRPDCHESCN